MKFRVEIRWSTVETFVVSAQDEKEAKLKAEQNKEKGKEANCFFESNPTYVAIPILNFR